MRKNEIIIYKITNKINNFVYIGQTHDLNRRWSNHCKKSQNTILSNAIAEYGKENFTIESIDTCEERHKLIIEEYYIRHYTNITKGNMYNLNFGGRPNDDLRILMTEKRNSKDDLYRVEPFIQKMSSVTRGEKNGMYDRKGMMAINGQHVFKLDDNLNIIEEFVSVREALKSLNIRSHVELNKACREKTKYHGFYWIKTWKK